MALQLQVRASYRKAGDLLEMLIYLYESTDKKFHPELLTGAGTVRLLQRLPAGDALLGTVDVTKFHGNADGAFRVFFPHPETITDLVWDIDFDVGSTTHLLANGTFSVIEPTEAESALPKQPDNKVPSNIAPLP